MVVQPTAPSLKEILQTQLLVLESFHVVLTFNPTIFLFSPFFGLCVISLQIFVGGLDPNVTDEDLRTPFSEYGDIVSVKIPVGKGCGFVQFANRYYSGYRFCDNSVAHIKFDPHSSYVSMSFTLGRNNAEEALQKLTGTTIGKQTVRLSWGRNPANKQVFVLSLPAFYFSPFELVFCQAFSLETVLRNSHYCSTSIQILWIHGMLKYAGSRVTTWKS